MDVSTHAPTPGSTEPGNLYVDLQSRTIWLRVDPAVDPSSFVLISDIVALQDQIASGDASARAYTDGMVALRAPLSHTHTSSQITDFNAAVVAVASGIPALQFTRGMVMMYSGLLSEIGAGPLAGWHLCDGQAGTPDLRDRFVLGAGSRVIGATNPSPSFDTAAGGTHDHTIAATAITAAQMPSHAHSGATVGRSADHAHYSNFLTGGRTAAHTHNPASGGQFVTFQGSGTNLGTTWGGGQPLQAGGGSTAESSDHQHWVQGWSGGENVDHTHGIYAEGGNQGHTHTTIGGGGSHQHNITTLQLRESVPFYALAYIMKL